jgi:serine/threonine-protein kinase HipA
MKDNVVTVYLYGREICKLIWEGGYRKGFGKIGSLVSFHPEYHSCGFDVDPLGPFRSSNYFVRLGLSEICRRDEYEGLPRFLSGSLPDDWGNQVFSRWIAANGIRSHDVTAVDKLAFIGKRGMGGFEFVPQMYEPSSSESLALEELYKCAREILADREDNSITLDINTGINDLMSVGMSAGGKHPKAIIAINWDTKEIRSGQILLPESFRQYILKFRDSDSWPTAEIEYVYYLMAKECGIRMEESSLLEASGVNHFLTERFDRKFGKKLHSATLRSLCGEVSSYDEIFKACRALHTPYADMDQIFRRAVFNYLSGVTDDHDKNFSFLMDEKGMWRLSPAYDVTFTVNYKNRFIGDRHAMSIEECDRAITRAQLLRLATENDIHGAGNIIKEIEESVKSFPTKASSLLPEKYICLISEFIQSQLQNL